MLVREKFATKFRYNITDNVTDITPFDCRVMYIYRISFIEVEKSSIRHTCHPVWLALIVQGTASLL